MTIELLDAKRPLSYCYIFFFSINPWAVSTQQGKLRVLNKGPILVINEGIRNEDRMPLLGLSIKQMIL